MRVSPTTEHEYLSWLAANRNGYVVNCYRIPKPNYLILHRATCYTINDKPAKGKYFVERDYRKECSEVLAELRLWAETEVGGQPKPCGCCKPVV